MSYQLLNNLTTTDESAAIASRRSFLARMAYGSLLAMSGSTLAHAAKHTSHSSSSAHKKADAKPAKSHAKNTLHDRLALKAEHNNRHSDHHKELALHGKHDKHIHSVLNGKHESHRSHTDFHERIAMRDRDRHSRIHHTLHKDYQHGQMREFALQEDVEEFPTFHKDFRPNRFSLSNNSIAQNRFVSPNSNISHRALSLQNMTTGDSLDVTYFEQGKYLPDALDEINFLYRDHLTDEVHPIDTALLDQLHDLQNTLGVGKRPIHVICGYRSPYTNAHLRRHSHGVARNSLHMQGRAIDIRMTGVDSRTIRDAALSMARGGVGYYPGSNFVHLDTGGFRTW